MHQINLASYMPDDLKTQENITQSPATLSPVSVFYNISAACSIKKSWRIKEHNANDNVMW